MIKSRGKRAVHPPPEVDVHQDGIEGNRAAFLPQELGLFHRDEEFVLDKENLPG